MKFHLLSKKIAFDIGIFPVILLFIIAYFLLSVN